MFTHPHREVDPGPKPVLGRQGEERDPWTNFETLIQQSWCLFPLSSSSKAPPPGREVGHYPVEAREWREWPEPHGAEWSLGCLGEWGEAMGLR